MPAYDTLIVPLYPFSIPSWAVHDSSMPQDDCKTAENLCNYSFKVDKLNRYTHVL